MIKINQGEISEMQGFGITVPLDFILKNAFKFNKKQIRDFRMQQLEDAKYRHLIASAESNGDINRALLNEMTGVTNIIPFTKYTKAEDSTGIDPEGT